MQIPAPPTGNALCKKCELAVVFSFLHYLEAVSQEDTLMKEH